MRFRYHFLLIALAGILAQGCAVPSQGGDAHDARSRDNEPFNRVEVFFATDRKATEDKNPYDKFSGERAATISYGSCEVSIPKDHRMGEIESSLLQREWLESPDSDVVLQKVTVRNAGEFFKNTDRRSAFVFVHGFNVRFSDAAKRTAQIAYDLGFKGAPIFFSWPSRGELSASAYHDDEAEAAHARDDLKKFLSDYLESTRTKHLYLIAHSMGNRPMTGAIADLIREHPEFRPRIKEVILAAPDIDAREFKTTIAPALTGEWNAQRLSITLYVSAKDKALRYVTNHVDDIPRVGDAATEIPVISGIQTIDASEVDTSFYGHCYYAENRSVISDIFYLMRQNPEDRFGLQSREAPGGNYWSFKR